MRSPANTYHSNENESKAQFKIFTGTRQRLVIRMEEKFAIILTENQFTPCNFEGQLTPRKRRSWVSTVWSSGTVQTWRRTENVDPSRESLYWRQLYCPSVYGYEHTNWQFTSNVSIRQTLNYASVYERRQCECYCELTPQTWQVNWMQIQPVRTELGEWLRYRPGCTHAMLQECLRARLRYCNGEPWFKPAQNWPLSKY